MEEGFLANSPQNVLLPSFGHILSLPRKFWLRNCILSLNLRNSRLLRRNLLSWKFSCEHRIKGRFLSRKSNLGKEKTKHLITQAIWASNCGVKFHGNFPIICSYLSKNNMVSTFSTYTIYGNRYRSRLWDLLILIRL